MNLTHFLSTFLINHPRSKLVVNCNDEIRDYFINVVPLLYGIDTITNSKNQFGDIETVDYDVDVTINILYNLHAQIQSAVQQTDLNLTKMQFTFQNGNVTESHKTGGQISSDEDVDVFLPLRLFTMITTPM